MRNVVIAASLLALSVGVQADSLKATAVKTGNQASLALANKDFNAFATILRPHVTSNFKYTEPGASMGFDQMVAQIKKGVGMLPKVTGAYSRVQSCVEHGSTGTTHSVHGLTALMTSRDRKQHKLVVIGYSKDSWVKVGGKWKLSVMAWGTQKTTLDGKPINLMGTPSASQQAKLTKIKQPG